ncbi:TPA: hypothetical protein ACQ7FF_005348 [Klebsiella pneumoniae]|uniref:hypothetical protein n=1 Tax=Klebsiella pneumoniae TaxID=573 RepID=UPI000E2CA794|nr:hypothetical protein [Klebsiella pneumoniae]HCQ8676422.1 hypothetical protein [Klebsiella variicola]MBW3333869.1 hypothetical protein [Klebsiella pneumoniae]MEB5808838.1 hypothetical protein [Klebsiella pneumoniae]SWX96669.1 Uncharacterised protein [Klebsiella pneumoniae]HBQ6638431.1 hypothetical protein [Klebsiella pneumoniae]
MKSNFLYVALAASIIAGCDQSSPAGAGVSSGESSSQEQTQQVQRNKQISTGQGANNITETAAFPMIQRAIASIYPNLDPGIGANLCSPAREGKTISEINEMVKNEIKPAEYTEYLKNVDGVTNIYLACAVSLTRSSIMPMTGWTFERNFDEEAKLILAMGLAASRVLSPIAVEISKRPGMDEGKLTTLIQDRFIDTNEDVLNEFIKELQQTRSFSIDGTGAKGIHFTSSDGYDVVGNGNGIIVSSYGSTWYGNGYFEGVFYKVSTIRSNSTNMTKDNTITSGSSISSGESSSADVSTK